MFKEGFPREMKSDIGLWIDHKEAVIVTLTANEEAIHVIASRAENHPGRFIGREADDRRQREYTSHLNIYYDAVIESLRDARSILIFGPGEAKGELKRRLEKDNLDGRIAAVETTDKMTNAQIAAKVREYYSAAARTMS